MNTPAENAAPEQQPQPRLYALSSLLGDFRADATAAHEARTSGKPRGPITGIASLDRELSGALTPGVHGIHGNAGAGKTAFAWQVAASCQCPALFVTCEMGPVELLRRLTARATSTYLGRLKSGEMTPAEAEARAREAIESAPQLHMVDATIAAASPQYLLQAASIVRGDSKHFLLVVDSLHSWAGALSSTAPGASEYETLNAGVAALQSMAAKLQAPVLFVAERNRDSMKSGGLNAGAGTRKIEYAGETVISLDRDTDAREDGGGEVPVKLKFAKNRNGAAGRTVDLLFHGALQRFREAKAQ
jgi:replicative DNA helicase